MSFRDRLNQATTVKQEVVDLGIDPKTLASSASTPLAVAVIPLKTTFEGEVFEYSTPITGGGSQRIPYEVHAAKFIALETPSTKKGEHGKLTTLVYVGFLGKPIKRDDKTGDPAKDKDGKYIYDDHDIPEEMCVEIDGELIPNLCEFRLAWGVNFQKSATKRLNAPEIKIAMSRNVPTNRRPGTNGQTYLNEDWDVIPFGRGLLHWAHNTLLVGMEDGNQTLTTIYNSLPTDEVREKDAEGDTEAGDRIDPEKVNAAADAADPVGVSVDE